MARPRIPTPLVEVSVVDAVPPHQPTAVFDRDAELAAGEVSPGPDGEWRVGVGDGAARNWRAAGAALLRAVDERAAADHRAERIPRRAISVVLPPGAGADLVTALVTGLVLGSHRYRISSSPPPPLTRRVELVGPPQLGSPAARAAVLAGATALARDLAGAPSDVKDPAWFARTAARLAGTVPGLAAAVRDERWLLEHGFGGTLAVGGGSARPPRLLELAWRPDGSVSGPHVALVGKGITFDTGGISIKPAEGLHLMRTDCAGGAAVIAAMLAVARLRLPVRVSALVPCAENHVSGAAYRPGDVLRHVDGTTTEVTNTDAEGRLVLADALGHAVRSVRPDVMVDVATLTGAMKVALGLRTGALFATCDDVAGRVTAAGTTAGEAWWRLPLTEAYAEGVRSEVADLRQAPPGPGAIVAALYLREFTDGLPWAHLDIAGPARAEKPYDEVAAGATGYAARTLVELVAGYG